MVKVIRPFCWHQTFDPKGLSAPLLGLYTCGKTLKNVYKIRVQRNVLKCTLNGQSDKVFLLISKFCPQGVVYPCPGAKYMWKNIKNMYKIRDERDFLKLATDGENDKAFLLASNF